MEFWIFSKVNKSWIFCPAKYFNILVLLNTLIPIHSCLKISFSKVLKEFSILFRNEQNQGWGLIFCPENISTYNSYWESIIQENYIRKSHSLRTYRFFSEIHENWGKGNLLPGKTFQHVYFFNVFFYYRLMHKNPILEDI